MSFAIFSNDDANLNLILSIPYDV